MGDTQKFQIEIVSTADNSGWAQSKQGAEELTKAQAGVVEVTEKDIKASLGDTEATERETLSKRELKEILRQLGPQFSMVGEAAGLAFNPATLAVGGLLFGLKSLSEVAEMVTENLAQVEMPDFDLDKVGEATRAWTGYADAVNKANESSSGAEAIYKRRIDGLKNELEITKALIEARKTQALADLESQKGSMSPEDYAASKKAITDAYAGDAKAAEGKESAAELSAKYDEQANLQATANQKAAQAKAIKLPENDKDAEGQIKAEQERLAKLNEEVDKRKKNREFISGVATGELHSGGISIDPEVAANRLKFRATYGWGGNIADADKQEREAQETAEANATGVKADIERRQKLLDDRKKLRGQAEDAQTKAATIRGELPQDTADATTKQIIDTLNTHGGKTNQALGDLAHATGKTTEQTIAIVTEILKHHLTMQKAIAQLERQVAEQARGGHR